MALSKSLRSLSALACLAVICLGFSCSSPEPREFRWQFKAGQKFEIVIEREGTGETEAEQETIQHHSLRREYYTWEVTEVDAVGNATITHMLTRLTEEQQTGEDPETQFDSADPDAEDPMAMWNVLILNIPVTFVVSPQGMIQSCTLSPAAEQAIQQTPMTIESMANVRRRELESLLIVFPEEIVSPGEAWSETFDLDTLELAVSYTYSGQRSANSEFETESSLAYAEPPDRDNAMQFTEVGTGQVQFDAQAGYMREKREQLTRITHADSEYLNFDSEVKITTVVTMRRVEE